MTEVPRISIDEPHALTDEERERVAYALGELAQQVRHGVIGTIPPSMPSQTIKVSPVQGLVIEVAFTRPKV